MALVTLNKSLSALNENSFKSRFTVVQASKVMMKFRPSTYHNQLKAMILLVERSVDGRNFNVMSYLCLYGLCLCIDGLSFRPACLLGLLLIQKFVEIFTERS